MEPSLILFAPGARGDLAGGHPGLPHDRSELQREPMGSTGLGPSEWWCQESLNLIASVQRRLFFPLGIIIVVVHASLRCVGF